MNGENSVNYRLDSCVWEITRACPFSCKYCGSRAGKARENELTTAECVNVAAQLQALGCRRVSLIGGEVFTRPDWATVLTALTSRGIRTCVITNGFRMTDGILSKLKAAEVESVAVSLDATRALHDAYRQEGSFDAALRAIKALADAGIPVSVISALRADNAPKLPELYEVLKDLPIFAWQIQACSPMGNAESNCVDVRFDAKKVISFVYGLVGKAKFYVGVADNIGYFTPEEGSLRGNPGAVYRGCSAGLSTIGIDSVGNVRGCESMYDERFNEGNLRQKSLAEIWNDPDAFSYNRRFSKDLLTGRCAGCAMGELCAGGCRS